MKKIRLFVTQAVLTIGFSSTTACVWAQLTDMVLTPVVPCRILDTRNTSILNAGETRGFNGQGVNSFQGQGGMSGNCNIPKDVPIGALAINFTVVNPSSGGFITAFPADDSPQPMAATVNFSAGAVVGNNATLKISQNQMSYAFYVYTTSQTHLVADVVGYFNVPYVTALDCYKTVPAVGAINVANSGRYLGNATAQACAVGYSPAGTNCLASSYLVNLTGIYGSKCDANHSLNTATISASQRCCRVPGR